MVSSYRSPTGRHLRKETIPRQGLSCRGSGAEICVPPSVRAPIQRILPPHTIVSTSRGEERVDRDGMGGDEK